MAKKKEERSPSWEEFLRTVEQEYAFLVEEGYSREVTDEYKVEFAKGERRLKVYGESWGFSAGASFWIGEREIPLGGLWPKGARRVLPGTDSPQLDALRKHADVFRNELRGLMRGDQEFTPRVQAVLAEEDRQDALIRRNRERSKEEAFFVKVDGLFKEKKFQDCVRLLETGEFPLTEVWKAKLEYAKKHL